MSERLAMPLAESDLAADADLETRLDSDDMLEIRFWLRLLTCTTMIEREVQTRLRRDFGMTLARFDILAQLERAGNGLTMGALSRRMMVTHGNVTGLVDRLVKDGLAVRRPVEGDRRANRIVLTEAGRRDFRRMAKTHHGWICDMLGRVSKKDLETAYDMLGRLKSSVRAETQADAMSRAP